MAKAATNGDDGAATGEKLGIDPSKSLFGLHMAALLRKRLLAFKRDKKMWAFILLIPAVFVLLGILVLLSISASSEPALELTPEVAKRQHNKHKNTTHLCFSIFVFDFCFCLFVNFCLEIRLLL